MEECNSMLYTISLFTSDHFLAHHVESKNQYSLLLFFSGNGQCRIGGNIPFDSGDIVLLKPGCNIDFICNESTPASVVIIQIPQHFISISHLNSPLRDWVIRYFDSCCPDIWLHLSARPLSELNAQFRIAYTEYCASQPGSAELSQLMLESMIAWIARIFHLQTPIPSDSSHKLRGMEIVEHARRIVALEFSESLSLDSVAKRCFVTPVYLSKLFREKTGLPFNRYLNLVRVSNACRLLLDTDELAVDIGEASGFCNTPHFNHTFRKLTGFTPLEYRRRFKYKSDILAEEKY